MLIPDGANPAMSTYYRGAIILKIFFDIPSGVVDPEVLFSKFEEIMNGTSYDVFIYALSWLYMIDAVDVDHDGRVRRCF